MSLDMGGFIDSTFKSVTATLEQSSGGGYVDGIYVQTTPSTEVIEYVNMQPSSDRQIQTLDLGGQRVTELQTLYINDGAERKIAPQGEWSFTYFNSSGDAVSIPGVFKAIDVDNRPWRNYCRVIVSLVDE